MENMSKLDMALSAFDVPNDTTGEQLNDDEIEEDAENMNDEIKPEIKPVDNNEEESKEE